MRMYVYTWDRVGMDGRQCQTHIVLADSRKEADQIMRTQQSSELTIFAVEEKPAKKGLVLSIRTHG